MPDPTWETVSASQAPALLNLSPYATRWSLWHAFKRRDASLIEAPDNERMRLGRLYQAAILGRVAEDHRLDVIGNEADEYVRRPPLGCTRDAHMMAPDLGRVIVEVKRVHWLRWREAWTETAAPMHIEIQLQAQLYAEECGHGLIACDTGDDELVYHRRLANPEVHQRLEEEARLFFESLAANREPDPLGSPLELPVIAALYPDSPPTEILEDYEDEELAQTIRLFDSARRGRGVEAKIEEQMKAKLLARAGSCGIVRANGLTAYIKRVPVDASICAPHAEPKEIRKAFRQVRIEVRETTPVVVPKDPFDPTQGPLING